MFSEKFVKKKFKQILKILLKNLKVCKNIVKVLLNFNTIRVLNKINEHLYFYLLSRLTAGWDLVCWLCSPSFSNSGFWGNVPYSMYPLATPLLGPIVFLFEGLKPQAIVTRRHCTELCMYLLLIRSISKNKIKSD